MARVRHIYLAGLLFGVVFFVMNGYMHWQCHDRLDRTSRSLGAEISLLRVRLETERRRVRDLKDVGNNSGNNGNSNSNQRVKGGSIDDGEKENLEGKKARKPGREKEKARESSESASVEIKEATARGTPTPIRTVQDTPTPKKAPEPPKKSGYTPETTAVLVFTYKRANHLRKMLGALLRHKPGGGSNDTYPIFVSQDGSDPTVAAEIQSHRPAVTHLVHEHSNQGGGYYAIARHYGWALRRVFGADPRIRNVILIEEDLVVSPDFFDYFAMAGAVLDRDESLWCASAWNDNGQSKFVDGGGGSDGGGSDPDVDRLFFSAADVSVHRTDFFPGLGWLMPRRTYERLIPKWPPGYWDDWMREPRQRQGLSCLRPELSRVSNVGINDGVSGGQFGAHLRGVRRSELRANFPIETAESLSKERYDAALLRAVRGARVVGSVREIPPAGTKGAVRIDYGSFHHFRGIARELGIMTDEKAGVPRTAYYGIITVRVNGVRVFLVGSDGLRSLEQSLPAHDYPRV